MQIGFTEVSVLCLLVHNVDRAFFEDGDLPVDLIPETSDGISFSGVTARTARTRLVDSLQALELVSALDKLVAQFTL